MSLLFQLVGIAIFNLFVYKCLDARHRSLTITIKIVIGMSLAFLTALTAGIIEIVRGQRCHHGMIISSKELFILFISSNPLDNKDDLSIYYLLIQNFGIGFSQLFAVVASYEYAYLAAPIAAQSLFMSLHFCSAGMAQFIGVAYAATIPQFNVSTIFSVSIKTIILLIIYFEFGNTFSVRATNHMIGFVTDISSLLLVSN